MAGRGPPPVPTALRILRGNPRQHALNKNEPIPPDGEIRCPRWLSPSARREWRYYLPILRSMKVMTPADVGMLANYCDVLATIKACREVIEKAGGYTVDDEGRRRMLPEVKILQQAQTSLRGYAQELGLTPSARSRIKVEKVEKSDPMDELLMKQGS